MIFDKCPKCKTELDKTDVIDTEKQIRHIDMKCCNCNFTSEITITSQGMFGSINGGKKPVIDLDKMYAEAMEEEKK